MSQPKKFVLLGATGSIGENTLRVLRKHPDKLQLVGISARQQVGKLAEIAHEFSVPYACLENPDERDDSFPKGTELLVGQEGIETLAALPEADIVVVAVVGAAGLLPTLSAVKAGKNIVLANKEALVVGGELVTQAANRYGATIIPADSEHNAVFQCLHGQPENSLDSIILTASGGPFRDLPIEEFKNVTLEQALNHPNWSMGKKITIDSATMANKGLELIEARWLFDLHPDQIKVVIHPQQIIHSMVQFKDASILAQLGTPDMRVPIACGLSWPERITSGASKLDFSTLSALAFEDADAVRFPGLHLSWQALKAAEGTTAVLNAANEVAVDAFLSGRLRFDHIHAVNLATLDAVSPSKPDSLAALLDLDTQARHAAEHVAGRLAA